MIWKRETGMHVAYQNESAVAVITVDYRQSFNSEGKFYRAYLGAKNLGEFNTVTEAKRAVETFLSRLSED